MSDEKKLPKGALVYDLCSVPDGVTIDQIVDIWKGEEFIIYDSRKGNTPVIHDPENTKGILVDISTAEEEVLKQIEKLLKS